MLADALERALADVRAHLGRADDGELRVVLDATRPRSERAGVRCSWQLTRLRGPRLAVGGLEQTLDLDAWMPSLRHELAHAAIHSRTAGRVPAWFEEGVAERLARGDTAASAPSHPIAEPLALVRWPFANLPPADWDAAFADADAATSRLFARGSWSAVQRMLAAVAGGMDFDAALEASFGITSDVLTASAEPGATR